VTHEIVEELRACGEERAGVSILGPRADYTLSCMNVSDEIEATKPEVGAFALEDLGPRPPRAHVIVTRGEADFFSGRGHGLALPFLAWSGAALCGSDPVAAQMPAKRARIDSEPCSGFADIPLASLQHVEDTSLDCLVRYRRRT
jgi:hypothetical protein